MWVSGGNATAPSRQRSVQILINGEMIGTAKGQTTGASYDIAKTITRSIDIGSGAQSFAAAIQQAKKLPTQILVTLVNAAAYVGCDAKLLDLSCNDVGAIEVDTCHEIYDTGGPLESDDDLFDCLMRVVMKQETCQD
jgi:hypothetical protein